MKMNEQFKLSLLALTVATTLSACTLDLNSDDDDENNGGETPAPMMDTVSFASISVPLSENAQQSVRASNEVTVNGKVQSIGYHKLMNTAHEDTITGEIFGLAKNYLDEPIQFEDGSDYICNGTNAGVGSGLDYTSILQKNDKMYMVSQFECQIGAMYIQEIAQDTDTGMLSPVEGTLEFISQKDEFGGWVHCAGMVTPWQSHLGSEEYEPSGKLTVDDSGATSNNYYNAVAPYWNGDLTMSNPYYYGWTPEVKVTESGEADYAKHYSMGRMSHELAYVMPDNRTVYLTDDGTNVGLFMFVADKEKDLSAGTLYAVKWNQTSSENHGAADLTWVNLGHANNAEIREFVATKPMFDDIFELADDVDNVCPETFTAINTSAGLECVKLKDVNQDSMIDEKDEKLASRLETRRFAAYKGATTEFRKEEGITFNAKDSKLYLAMSEVARGMEDDSSNDKGGYNDIRLPKNSCGAVYELNVSADESMDSMYVAKDIAGIVGGMSMDYTGTEYEGNKCDVNSIASPDNVSYLAESNVLIIGEDTSAHNNNMIWSFDLNDGSLTRILTTPLGAETTSPYWYKDINGFTYLTAVTQHPSGREDNMESEIGYVGPIKLK